MDIPRRPDPDELHCWRCDFYGFERRPGGNRWAFCYWKGRHFPDDIEPGAHSCFELSIKGKAVLKDE